MTEQTDWQPISSAPRDGTHIYVVCYVPNWPASLHYVSTASWWNGHWWTEDRNDVEEPTHWRPITIPKDNDHAE